MKKRLHEELAINALSKRGHVMQLWVGANGRWSVVIVNPNGTACLIDFGDALQPMLSVEDEGT